MRKVTVDAVMWARLKDLSELPEICDGLGRTLGYFHPLLPAGNAKAPSAFSEEEIERRRQHRTRCPLGEILQDRQNR
jgi:hypothetical protein